LHQPVLQQTQGESRLDALGGHRAGQHLGGGVALANDTGRIGDQAGVVLGEPGVARVLHVPFVPDLVIGHLTLESLAEVIDVAVERRPDRLGAGFFAATVVLVAIAEDELGAQAVTGGFLEVAVPGRLDLQLVRLALDIGPVGIGAHGGDAGIAHHGVGAAAGITAVQLVGADTDDEGFLGGLCGDLQGCTEQPPEQQSVEQGRANRHVDHP